VIIVGAGLTGLIAGHVFPNATIVERAASPASLHRALLRFRSNEVATLVGIPFRKVRVHKAIYFEGAFRPIDPRLANLYAAKCLGSVTDRSIWDLAPVDRWIAPEDFYERLVDARQHQIKWGTPFGERLAFFGGADLISTIPLSMMALMALLTEELPATMPEFKSKPITVTRWRAEETSVHQTIYFPGGDAEGTYRVSITGDLVIQESIARCARMDRVAIEEAFGLPGGALKLIDETDQSLGKIAPIDNSIRKELIYKLTTQARVYSVGRFATWRNILLDDVLNDLRVVKGMIEQRDRYSLHKSASR